MTAGWVPAKLGDVCEFLDYRRKPITKRDRTAGEFPYYGATGIVDYVGDYLFDEPLVLIGEDGAKWDANEETAFLVEGKYWVNNHAHVIRPCRERVLDSWLVYYLNHSDLTPFVSGLTVPKLNQGNLREITIPLPPLPEQQRIVAILDEAFAAIATAKANTEKNIQNARAIFDSHLECLFAQRTEGWTRSTLGEKCTLRSGTTLPKRLERATGEIPYLKVADMNLVENLDGIRHSTRYVNQADLNSSSLLPVGTTIFPKRGGAILTNKKRLTTRTICADLNIMGVTPRDGLLPEFLFNYFLRLDLREINNGSSIPQINNYSIEPLVIAFPESVDEQKRIVDDAASLAAETRRLAAVGQRKLAALGALEKSLLHHAFTGQL